MGVPRLELAAVLHLPQTYRAVLAAGGQQVGVGPPRKARDRACVTRQREEIPPGRGLPDDHTAIAVARGEKQAVGTERRGGDPVGVLPQFVQQLSCFGRVDSDDPLRAAKRHEPLVRADVGRQHSVEFRSQLRHAPAGDNVPDNDPTAGSTAAAAGQQQAAASAELEDLRPALGKGEYASELPGVSAIEQHLLLAADSSKRGPWTRCDRRAGVEPPRANHRLQRNPGG